MFEWTQGKIDKKEISVEKVTWISMKYLLLIKDEKV